jgi:acyl transferase domain-containing protein
VVVANTFGVAGSAAAAPQTLRTVFMFAGQGSQHYHMGRELFERQGTFRRHLLAVDAMARDLLGRSVVSAIYDETRHHGDPFERLMLTHPAIFMVEYALAQALIEKRGMPELVLGASLGTFAAAVIAGCLGVEQALAALIGQARQIEACCPRGGMIAVLADPALYDDLRGHADCDLAGVNFDSHFVVSARSEQLGAVQAYLRHQRIGFLRIPVEYAFHSRWIDAARAGCAEFVRTLRLRGAKLPLVCCAHAGILSEFPSDYLWRVAREPIRFLDTIRRLEEQGGHRYIDIGPSSAMATLLKYALPVPSQSVIHSTLSRFGHDARAFASLTS